MNPLRVFLVDDEQLALRRLTRLLEKTERVTVVGSSSDPLEAICRIEATPYDVLFTDIEMPELSGFQMLARIEPQPLVVFTTAYSNYALQAFEVNSIDYLLKPINEKQLERALSKLDRVRGGLEPRPKIEKLVEQLSAALLQKPSYPARIPSRLGERIEFVDVARVTHFYANDKLTYASTPKKDFIVDYTITQLEEMLDPSRFVRIHRATIANLDYVRELYSWFSDRLMLRIEDGKDTELTVARDRVRTLKDKLGL